MFQQARGSLILAIPLIVVASLIGLRLHAGDRGSLKAPVVLPAPSPIHDAPAGEPLQESERPRDDWVTRADGREGGSYQDLTIPAGFFGPGCQAFEQRVYFKGVALEPTSSSQADTILERSADPVLPSDALGTMRTVSLELKKLSLVSTEPICVTCGGTSELWDVHVCLSPAAPPTGWLTAKKTDFDGGTFDSTFWLQPLLTFTNVAHPDRVLVLDTAGVSDAVQLTSTSTPFRFTALSATGQKTCFLPGIAPPRAVHRGVTKAQKAFGFRRPKGQGDDPVQKPPSGDLAPNTDGSTPGGPLEQTPVIVHRGPGHQHCVEPPVGACCFASGTCFVLTEVQCASAGGGYEGTGTSCDPNPCGGGSGLECPPYCPEDFIPPAGRDLYPQVTVTATVYIPGHGQEIITLTGWMLNERGEPYTDTEERYGFDWYVQGQEIVGESSIGTITVFRNPDLVEVHTARSPIPVTWSYHPCYPYMAAVDTSCSVYVYTGEDVFLAVPDGDLFMQSDLDVLDTPPVHAHFSLVAPVDYVTPVSRELVFTFESIDLDTGPLVRGACDYGDQCFVVPEFTCLDAGGAYHGDGTTCP